jgi:hypothetical protein
MLFYEPKSTDRDIYNYSALTKGFKTVIDLLLK